MIQIRPIKDAAELQELVNLAGADSHEVIGATHVVRNDGTMVGYLSLGGIATVNVWLDSRGSVGPRDSLEIIRTGEAIMSSQGHRRILVPCAENSPFKPHMERLGFKALGNTVLHWKAL